MSTPARSPLFDAVLSASGLSPVFGAGALARAVARAGVDPGRLGTAELARTLPAIEQALGVFLKPDEVATRMAAIAALAHRYSA